MRQPADPSRVRRLLEELGRRARGPGEVEFFHFDLLSQALAKIARAHERDLLDVRAMTDRGLVSKAEIASGLEQIRPELIRYPALDAEAFERRVRRFLKAGDA